MSLKHCDCGGVHLVAEEESDNRGDSRDGDSDTKDEIFLGLVHLLLGAIVIPLTIFALALGWEYVVLSLGWTCS